MEMVEDIERSGSLWLDVRVTAIVPIQFITFKVTFGGQSELHAPETICLAVNGAVE